MSKTVGTIVDTFEKSLVELLLDKIKTYTEKQFKIEDVFGREWDRIPVSTRKNIGRKFAKEVTANKIQNIEFLKKDSANTQWYINKL